MKNASLILNIVLLVAVATLFYLHFSSKKGATSTSGGSSVAAGDLQIAYVNTDTVVKYYEFVKVRRKALDDKAAKMEQDYGNRVSAYQNEVAQYQRDVNSMTLGQVKAVEEDLGKKQQNLQMYQQTLNQQLSIEEGKMTKDLYDRITAYLKKYGTEKGLQVVLQFTPGSGVLYAQDGLDISKDVIKGLNDEYASEGKTGAKADSTATKK